MRVERIARGACLRGGTSSGRVESHVRELAPGIWHWQARHPGWSEGEPWDPNVSSYAIDDGERLLVFDPIAPPDELVELAAARDTVVVLTSPWHERDMQGLVERLGVEVYAPRPDSAQDLMDKWGITAEQAGDGSPDLVWLRAEAPITGARTRPTARCPLGSRRTRAGSRTTSCSTSRATARSSPATRSRTSAKASRCRRVGSVQGITHESRVERLRPLLEKPVEHVLATHGGPFEPADLERALS